MLLVSRIGIIELRRAVSRRRLPPDGLDTLLEHLDVIPLSETILTRAASIGPPLLRTLDAVHLATALTTIAVAPTFLTYDERLSAAARNVGFATIAPS